MRISTRLNGLALAIGCAVAMPVIARADDGNAAVANIPRELLVAQNAQHPGAVIPPPVSSPHGSGAVIPPPGAPSALLLPAPPLPVAAAPPVVAQHREIAMDYPGLILRLLKDNPDLAKADRTIRWWTWYRFPNEYNPIANQEFKLQPLLERGRQDLAAAMANYDPERVIIRLSTQFGTYDFTGQKFPITPVNTGAFTRPPVCCIQADLPAGIQITMEGSDAVTSFPMPNQMAQTFVEKRTRWGNVDRTIGAEIQLKLDSEGVHQNNFGNWVVSGSVESITLTSATDGKGERLYTVGPSEMAQFSAAQKAAKETAAAVEKARQDAAAAADRKRQEGFRHQQLMAQRDQNIRMLTDAPVETRLWNFIQTGDIVTFRSLDSARNIRVALSRPNGGTGQIPAVMAIQAGASGRDKVATKWPGHLDVTLADGKSELKSGQWYLVSGTASFEDGDEPQSVGLAADALYACTQQKCADAADPTAIVDRHLAASNVQGAN